MGIFRTIIILCFIVHQNIAEFFNSETIGIKEISSINLIIQASQARLTDEQLWVFNRVLDIFGNDVEKNIR